MYIQPFGETQQSIMIEAINETTDLKDPKITNSVIQNNQEFVKLVFGTAGVEAVLEATEITIQSFLQFRIHPYIEAMRVHFSSCPLS